MADAPPPPPELRTVKLSTVIHRAVERTYKELIAVAQKLEEKSDRDRKIALRDLFQNARNRLIKLLVLVKWSAHVPAVKASWDLEHFLMEQDASLEGAAARLYAFMGTIKDARAPNYDIPTAIDVLTTGNYSPLPTAVKNIIPPPPIAEDEEKQILKRLNDIISMRLFHSKLPPHFSVRVEDGRVYLKVKNEFEVSLTVYGEDPKIGTEAEQVKKYPWIVLSIDLFISSSAGVKEDTDTLFPPRFMNILKDRLQQRMARADHPLEELYIIMHAVCVPLQIGVLATQAQVLSRRLAPDVKVDYVPEKELRIYYWRELAAVKPPGHLKRDGMEAEWPIYLQIVVDERQLSVTHTPTIMNPVSGEEVKLVVRSTSLNLEHLFQQTLQYHSYSLLFALQEALFADTKLGLFSDDVRLINANQGTQTYLKIRLFNPHYLFISIDLRSGRFLLKAPVGVIDQEVLLPLEAKLNKDPSHVPSIVRELRHKALLYHFSRIAGAESLRVEAFHDLLKAPPSGEPDKEQQHVFSKNTLYLRFRDVPDYFLAIEIEEQDFAPKFYLLVTKKSTQSALIHIHQVVPLADAFFKSSPFLIPSLSSSSSTSLLMPHTPFSTFSTPMPSPYPLMSPSPMPSPASFLHEQASIPADIAKQIKQERERDKEKEKEREREKESEASNKRKSDKGKEKDGATPPTTPPAAGAKRKAEETDGNADGEGKVADESKRPRHTATTPSSSSGDRVVPYQSLLSSIVSNCRKTITSLMMRRFFEESKGISCKSEDNGDLLFTIPLNDFKMPISQMRISFLGDFKWVVIVEESKPTFSVLAPYISAKQPPHLAGNITYEPGHGWRFEYDHVADDKADSLKIFLRDLRGVTRMTALANGLESVLSNAAQYGHLLRYFEVHRFTPTHLVLHFDEGQKELSISLSEEASFEITWSGFECGPVAPYFQFLLNARRSIAELLEAVYRTNVPLHMINSFLHTPTADNYLLANDISLIPRDVAHVRLIYKNILGVDVRILPNNLIHIEDASASMGIPTGLTGMHRRSQLLSLTNFSAFYTEHLLPLAAPTLSQLPQHDKQIIGLLTRDVLAEALGLLHQFMGVLYLYRQAGAMLKNEGFEDVKAEKPNKMVFTANKQSFSISISGHIHLALHSKTERKQETTALFGVPKQPPPDRADLTEEESAAIAAFFRRHVASPPFYHAVSNLTSLLRLLTLPLPVLQEFVQLMKRENERPADREGMGLRWLLSAPPLFSAASTGQPGVVHDRAAGTLSFVVGFSWKGRLRVGVGLQYRYQDRAWAAWPSPGPEPSPLQQLLSTLPPNPSEGMVMAAMGALERQPLEKLLSFAGFEP